MTTKRRRRFTANFKKRVVLEALWGDRTVHAKIGELTTMSRTFSMKNGSVDSLNVRCRCGWTPNSVNHRCTVLFETPLCAPSARVCGCRSISWLPSRNSRT